MGVLKVKRADGSWALPFAPVVAGSDRQVQYVNNHTLAAASNVEIAADGHIQLVSQAWPITKPPMTSPAAQRVKLALLQIGNAHFPFWIHATGRISPFLAGGFVSGWRVTPDSAAGGFGALNGTSITGGGSTRIVTSPGTSLTRAPRYMYNATASATAVCGVRVANTMALAGDIGGWLFHVTFGMETGMSNTAHRMFVGFRSTNVAPTDVDPSTLTNMLCIGYDSADTVWQAMSNDATGAATKTSLGAGWPKPSVDAVELYHAIFYQPWGVNEVNWLFINYETGAAATGAITTDLPAAPLQLYPHLYASVGGVSNVISFDVSMMEGWAPQ